MKYRANFLSKWLLIVFSLFPLAAIATEVSPSTCVINQQQKGSLQKKQGIYLLNLQGDYRQMGYCYGKLAAQPLQSFYQRLQTTINFNAPLNRFLLFFEEHTIPSRELQILQGISQGSGLNLNTVLKINFATDLLFVGKKPPACSVVMISKNRTTTHHTLIGRNYDFPKVFATTFMPYTAIVSYHPQHAHQVTVVGPLGMVSGLSAMNDAGLYNEINSGLIAFPFPRINPFALPNPMIQNLEVLWDANNLADVNHYYQHHLATVAVLIGVADKDLAYHFERPPYQYGRAMQTDENDQLWLTPDPSRNDIFTNVLMLKWFGMKQLTAIQQQGPSWARDRLTNLQRLVKRHNRFSPETLQAIMLTKIYQGGAFEPYNESLPDNPEATAYTLIVSPADRTLWLYVLGITPNWLKFSL